MLEVEHHYCHRVGARTVEQAGHCQLVEGDDENHQPTSYQGRSQQPSDDGGYGGQAGSSTSARRPEEIGGDAPRRPFDDTVPHTPQLGEVGKEDQGQRVA